MRAAPRGIAALLIFLVVGELAARSVDAWRDQDVRSFIDLQPVWDWVLGEDPEGSVHIRSADPRMVYALRPNVDLDVVTLNTRVVTNALGFRDRPRTPVPVPGVARVIVLGDSITFGWEIESEATWTAVAERSLRRVEDGGACPVEILNLGVGGYNTLQEAALLETRGLALQPDLVVVGRCSNDGSMAADGGLWTHFTRGPSRLVDWVRLGWTRRMGDASQEVSPQREGFGLIERLTTEAGLPVVVFDFPHFERGRAVPVPRPIRLGQDAGSLRVVELLPVLAASPEPVALDNERVHPNERGHALAGRALAAVVIETLGLPCALVPEGQLPDGVR